MMRILNKLLITKKYNYVNEYNFILNNLSYYPYYRIYKPPFEVTSIDRRCMSTGVIKRLPESFIHILEEYGKDKSNTYSYKEICQQVVDYHNQLIKDHGVIDGTKRFNTSRLYIIKLLEGLEPDCPDFFAISKKLKFPSKLFMMTDLYRNSTEGCRISDRIIRSILYCNRLVKDNNNLDIDQITRKFPISVSTKQEFRNHVKSWIKRVGFRTDRSVDLLAEPITRVMRSGPNGKMK